MDDTEDNDDWEPHFSSGVTPWDMGFYPVHKSYATLNFRHFTQVSLLCKLQLKNQLCEIIQKIIMQLYNGRPQRLGNAQFVQDMRRQLTTWLHELPDCIKLDIKRLPEHCPPPHIFSTK